MMDNRNFIAHRAAQYFHSGDVVNLGIGIPSLCGNYAENGVLFQSENGYIGVGATAEGLEFNERTINAGGIPFTPVMGACGFDVAMSFGVIRSGRMAATVLGALQVSEHGDLANWARPGSYPGMGGAMDLVSGIRDVIVMTDHCAKNGSPKIVSECTLPLTGRRVVKAIVTELALFDVSATEGLTLVEHREGVSVEEIRAKTGAPFKVAPDLKIM